MIVITSFDLAAIPITRAMPHVLPFVAPRTCLREGLRCVKFHTTLAGDQLTIAMLYGPLRRSALDAAWQAEVHLASTMSVF